GRSPIAGAVPNSRVKPRSTPPLQLRELFISLLPAINPVSNIRRPLRTSWLQVEPPLPVILQLAISWPSIPGTWQAVVSAPLNLVPAIRMASSRSWDVLGEFLTCRSTPIQSLVPGSSTPRPYKERESAGSSSEGRVWHPLHWRES